MAQTRLEKVGTIYSRMSGLLKSGAMKPEHKPIWFEVYEAFPPKYEPRFDRQQLPYGEGGNVEAMGPPRKIFYKEDLIRAQFYKVRFVTKFFSQLTHFRPRNSLFPTKKLRRPHQTLF